MMDGVKKLRSNDKYIQSFDINQETSEPEVTFKFK
jgi:hypothetical protein